MGRIRITAENLKEWRLYYQSATDVFPRWIAYENVCEQTIDYYYYYYCVYFRERR